MITRVRPAPAPLATAVLVAGLAVGSVVPFDALFTGRRPLVWAGGAVGVALAVAAVLRRRSLPTALAAHGIAFFAYLGLAVFRVGWPRPSRLATVWDAVTGGWAPLLGTAPPVVATPRLAVIPIVLAWVAGLIGVELASRTRWASPLLAAPFASYTAALAFTGHQRPASLAIPAGLIGLGLVVVLLRAQRPAGAARRPAPSTPRSAAALGPARAGRLAAGALTIAVLGVVGVVGATTIPLTSDSRRVDLHDRYVPPVDIDEAISPLSRVKGQHNDPSEDPLFTVRFTGVPANLDIDRVPFAVLEQFDGAVWGSRAKFAPAVDGLIPRPESPVGTALVGQHYELGAYPTPFIPGLERPVRATGTNLAFDATGGMLASRIRPPQGFRYEVESPVPMPTDEQLRAARSGNDAAVDQLSLPPPEGWPAEVRRFAGSLAASDTSRYALLLALEAELRSDRFGYDAEAPSGHSLSALTDLLAPLGPRPANGRPARVGSAEQFAAAFAVVARARGIASRVVVGYRIAPEQARAGVPIAVRPSAAHAWAEAWLREVGWVAFDPTRPTPRAPKPPDTPPPPESAPSSAPSASSAADASAIPGAATTPASGRPSSRSSLRYLVLAAGSLLLLVPSATVAVKAARRRRRRTQGPPRTRALGAWAETRDDLRSHGFAILPSMTIADAAGRLDLGPRPALAAPLRDALCPIVDLALYSSWGPDDNAATVAWDANADVRLALRQGSTRRRRALAAIDPRTVLRSTADRSTRRRVGGASARVRALRPNGKVPA